MRRWARSVLVILLGWSALGCNIDREGNGPVRPGFDAGRGELDAPAGEEDASEAGCLTPECTDGIPCTHDTCAGGIECTHLPDHGLCNEYPEGICDPTVGCQYPPPPGCATTCDDGDPCTDDVCPDGGGCKHPFNSAACDDGEPCTTGDMCRGGVCFGVGVVCDDSNPCTDDFCETGTGCMAPAHPEIVCDDGNPCTLDDTCDVSGACVGAPRVCFTACECDTATGACLLMGSSCPGPP